MSGSELSCTRLCWGGVSDGWGPQRDPLTAPKPLRSLPTQSPGAVTGSGPSSSGDPGFLPGRLVPPLALFCTGVSEGQEPTPQKLQARSCPPCLPRFQKQKQVPGGPVGSLQP